MTNDIIEPKTLESSWNIKWTEKIETIYPETIEVPNYDYGNSQNTLDYNIALRNKPNWWWNYKIGYFTFNSTWNVSITWVWFTPKLITFTYTDQTWWYWTWAMDWTSLFWYDVLWAPSQIQSECIYLRNSWWTAIWRAVFVSMDADWFTINKTLASTTIYVNYIAFW